MGRKLSAKALESGGGGTAGSTSTSAGRASTRLVFNLVWFAGSLAMSPLLLYALPRN
jgi:hypothetical protein